MAIGESKSVVGTINAPGFVDFRPPVGETHLVTRVVYIAANTATVSITDGVTDVSLGSVAGGTITLDFNMLIDNSVWLRLRKTAGVGLDSYTVIAVQFN